MRRETTSVSQEDYLKAIWELVQEEQAPISARLAEDLSVTPPAVTAALKRMARSGYLKVLRIYEKDPKFLEFIDQRRLRPTARLRLHRREYDETLAVSVGGSSAARIHLGKPATERIWVRRVSK